MWGEYDQSWLQVLSVARSWRCRRTARTSLYGSGCSVEALGLSNVRTFLWVSAFQRRRLASTDRGVSAAGATPSATGGS